MPLYMCSYFKYFFFCVVCKTWYSASYKTGHLKSQLHLDQLVQQRKESIKNVQFLIENGLCFD